MAYEYAKRHANKQSGIEPEMQNSITSDSSVMPNSAIYSMLNNSYSAESGLSIASQGRQIPAAEYEADRLSDGVHSATPDQLKQEMGNRLNADFSGVQFHSDAASAARADDMGARAWTKGKDVYFNNDGFDSRIAAHELVHTVQQGLIPGQASQSVPAGTVQMWPWGKKKNKLQKPAPNGQNDLDGWVNVNKEDVPVNMGHQLDIGSMEFDKKPYKKDADYSNIHRLMQIYNNIDETQDQAAKNKIEIQLMNAAMNYIDKASGGDKVKHKGRTAKLENMLYQLSMKGGTAQHANENIQKLQTANENSEAAEDVKQGAKNTFKGLQDVYGENSAYSPTMKMIVANVLADQDASGASAPSYTPTNSKSAAEPVFENGSTGYDSPHSYEILSHTHNSLNDSMGTTLHELTHVATGEVYNNTGAMFSIGKDASDESVISKIKKRIQTVKNLFKSRKTSKVKRLPDDTMEGLARNKLEYTAQNNVIGAASKMETANYQSLLRPYAEKMLARKGGTDNLDETGKKMALNDEIAPIRNAKDEATINYLTGQGPKPDNIPADLELDPEQQKSFKSKREMIDKMRHYSDLSIQNRTGDQKDKETLSEINKNNAKFPGFSDKLSSGANMLMEYDTVMNQMLLQHEHAGQNGQPNDRDSKFYRQLRNAALRAHLERREYKLQKQMQGL